MAIHYKILIIHLEHFNTLEHYSKWQHPGDQLYPLSYNLNARLSHSSQMDSWMLKRDWAMRELLGKMRAEDGRLKKIWISHQNW